MQRARVKHDLAANCGSENKQSMSKADSALEGDVPRCEVAPVRLVDRVRDSGVDTAEEALLSLAGVRFEFEHRRKR